jgi:hypothetical protein
MAEVRFGIAAGEYLVFAVEEGWQPRDQWQTLSLSDRQEIDGKSAKLLRRFRELGFLHAPPDRPALEARSIDGHWEVRFASLEPIRQCGTRIHGAQRRAA